MKVKICSECHTRALFVYRTFKYCKHCLYFIFGDVIYREKNKKRLAQTMRLALKGECRHINSLHLVLRDKILKFPELERRVIWRLFYEQTSLQRMADHMSIPIDKVADAYRSAVKRIYDHGYQEDPEFIRFMQPLEKEMKLALAA